MATKKEITSTGFANLLNFYVGLQAFSNLVDTGTLSKEAEQHLNTGLNFLRLNITKMQQGIDKYLANYAESINRQILLQRATEKKAPREHLYLTSKFLEVVLPRLAMQQGKMREIFTGISFKQVNQLSNALKAEDLAETVFLCSTNQGKGKPPRTTKWLRKAASLVKMPLTDLEVAVQEVSTAQSLGEQIRNVDTQIAFTDPNTETAERLQAKKAKIIQRVGELSEESVEPELVFQTAVNAAVSSQDHPNHRSKMGAKLGLSAEQEDAMLEEGLVEIVAGAGSGKTRVMAGKVAWLVREKGVPSHSIIATSFSRKSAKELQDRILKYGGPDVLDGGSQGIGTTHSLSLKLLREFAPTIASREILDNNKYLIRLAMKQVQMMPSQRTDEDPPVKGFFDDLKNTFPEEQQLVVPGEEKQEAEEEHASIEEKQFKTALLAVEELAIWIINNYGASRWVRSALKAAEEMMKKSPDQLTAQEKAVFNKITGLDGKRKSFRKKVERGLKYNNLPMMSKLASLTKEAAKKKQRSLFWDEPANEWFNLGVKNLLGPDGRGLSTKTAATAISNFKGDLLTPSQAWLQYKDSDWSIVVAVYGAYEWLKANDLTFGQPIDFDDALIETCKLLVGNKRVRETLQDRFKHILVDEGQDLNLCQDVLFGLIAGAVDPDTREYHEDCKTTAKTFAYIGDDKQCLATGTKILTPSGEKLIEEIQPEDEVLSYRNAKIATQKVKYVVPSSWEYGYEITTESGKKLLMSPNHKIWASDVQTPEDSVCVYLMHRIGMGFRVGITKKGHQSKISSRAVQEGAGRMWILDVCTNREEALLLEEKYSLSYGIPTCVFNGENRGLNQNRINLLFTEFGSRGKNLLKNKNLSFDYPHWTSSAYGKFGKTRRVINITAHTKQNSLVSMEWSDPKINELVSDVTKSSQDAIYSTGKNYRIRRYFVSYRDALNFANLLKDKIPDSMINERIYSPHGKYNLMTASGLFEGMEVLVYDKDKTSLNTEKILSVQKQSGSFIDLDVEDASNFFGNGILSHNSIYGFRGARSERFINKSDLKGGCFKTKLLVTNYRSGKEIVDAANRLIAHNTDQIPMKCQANVEKNGMGVINSLSVGTNEEGAAITIEKIDQMKEEIGYVGADGKPNFGVAVRTNAEAYAFAAECLKREIPFRSKLNFFNDPTTKSLLRWTSLANASDADRKDINEAVLHAHKSPGFMLDAYFENRLQTLASRYSRNVNYLTILRENYNNIYSGGSKWRNRNVIEYLDVLEEVNNMTGSPIEILNQIMDLRGVETKKKPARSMKESLIEEVKKDSDIMDRINEQTGGDPSPEDIEAEALAPLRVLLDLANRYEDTSPFVDYISELQDVNKRKHKSDDPKSEDYEDPAVVIDTVHGWKGLECHHLYVPMAGGVFPHAASEMDEAKLAEERRLAYVAITRGQESVTILSPEIGTNGKPAPESRFLSEACISPMGVESNTAELDEDRIEKTASRELQALYEHILEEEDGYEDFYDEAEVLAEAIESNWDFLGE